jgi:hypothetical protein
MGKKSPKLNSGNRGCFHAKFMILWFQDFVRIVISSANLVHYDWEDLENNIFVQDFPLKKKSSDVSTTEPDFKVYFCSFLADMGIPASVIQALGAYDFSKATAILVASYVFNVQTFRDCFF